MKTLLSRITLVILPAILFGVSLPLHAQITGSNWTGQYFNNTTLSGTPVATELYPSGIFANWGAGPPLQADNATPVPGLNDDNFSAIFTSTQTFYQPGTYTFTIYVDDGVRVYINNSLKIDQFNQNLTGTYRTFTFQYSVAVPSDLEIRAEFVEFSGIAIMAIQWGSGGPPSPYIHTYEPPDDSTVVGDVSPTLIWQHVGATSYKVKLKSDGYTVLKASFASGAICEDDCVLDLANMPFQPVLVLANGQYWWRVFAEGMSRQSRMAHFKLVFPGKPFALAPDFNLTVTNVSPVLAWGVVDAAAEYTVKLKHKQTGAITRIDWMAADPICDDVYCSVDLAALRTPIVLVPGKYTWRVSARDLLTAPNVTKSKTAAFKLRPEATPRAEAPVPPLVALENFRSP